LERERSVSWVPQFGNEFSPPTMDGTVQVRNGNGGGLWTATFSSVNLRTTSEILAWQKMEALLAGGLEPIDVPFLMCAQRPTPETGAIEIRTVGVSSARDIGMIINLVNASAVISGMHFSRYSNTYGFRMYRVTSVASVSGAPTQRSIGIWPPLRAGIGDNLLLDFTDPLCVMKVATPDAMRIDLDLRKRASPSVSFVEAF
jgi:hypothetical protein